MTSTIPRDTPTSQSKQNKHKIPQYLNSAALTHKKHFEKVANLLFSRSFGDCEAN